MCFLLKESLQEVQFQTHIESYRVRENLLTYGAETNVCAFLSLPRKSFQEFFLGTVQILRDQRGGGSPDFLKMITV